MKVIHLQNEDQDRWTSLLISSESSGFMQSWEWSIFKEKEGQRVLRIGILDEEQLVAGCMVYFVKASVGSSPLEIPHGPVIPWSRPGADQYFFAIKDELFNFAKENLAPSARLTPLISSPYPELLSYLPKSPVDIVPSDTLLIDLHSEEDVLSQMKEKGRYNIKKALQNGVIVTSLSDAALLEHPTVIIDFYNLVEVTAVRHSFALEPIGYFDRMIRTLGPHQVLRIYQAHYCGVLVATALVIFYGSVATYFYGGTLPFLTSSMAPYALHWKIIQDAIRSGCKVYDLFGVAPDDQPFHAYAKFGQFKSRFGGRKVKYFGSHDIYFYPQLAKLLANNIIKGEYLCK
ncbi:MAG: peptidoglycan bridge formation glycyltransferase FemA/FemB family protein [Oligoflexia bacterium]|nr:peptidoglycan bridge formation glycyltransferase FemA/FemB family protein [Oligoflexia bacterium]